jgi:hypothetical protein
MKTIQRILILLFAAAILLASAGAGAAEDKSIIRIGSDVTVETEEKVRSVVVVGGQVTVHGTVDRSVLSIGGSVVLTRTAVVGGNVTALGGVIFSARDAEVGGSLTEINSSNLMETLTAALSAEWEGWSWIFAVVSLAIFVVILVVALLIVALLPKPVRTISEAITQQPFRVILCGTLGLILVAPLALLLTISVVGIALIPLEVILVVSAVLLGFIAVGQLIGRGILDRLGRPSAGPLRQTLWGLIVLWVVGWIPYIGWMVKSVAIVVGLGATLVTRFGTHRAWECAPLPAAALPASAPPPPVTPDFAAPAAPPSPAAEAVQAAVPPPDPASSTADPVEAPPQEPPAAEPLEQPRPIVPAEKDTSPGNRESGAA